MPWLRRYPATLAMLLAGLLAVLATLAPPDPVASFGWHAAGSANWPLALVSAHFVHLGFGHLAVNVLAALLLGWCCDRFGLAGRLPAAALVALGAVDLGLVYGPWPIAWYVGLSGLLHGVFAWLTLSLVWHPGLSDHRSVRIGAGVLFLGGLLKVVTGLAVPVGGADWRGIPLATPVHIYGYLAGALWAWLRRDR